MNSIELLAPARDLETGRAAINCGADAIYLGAARFGAREAAGNPLGDIEHLIHYAHKYWARVYVTVNTLLYDAELVEAEKLVNQLYEAGADALIVQDAGLLELELPPIPLFASTQMHNHTPERVAFLERVGFQRAILARELTLDQIREIHAHTHLELETFIHGALCVSYSGQCYLSCAIGGRSGNRGQCAQPCRRPYSLVGRDGQIIVADRYLLSLHDLNLSASLADLVDAGVCSFKIEGRLKDKAYVMNVVGHYRRLLDAVLKDRSLRPAASGAVHLDFEPDPRKTFNRGYSTYFLHGRGADIAALDTPKSLGEPLGRVIAVGARSFTLKPGAPPLHPADGVCFFTAKKPGSLALTPQIGNRLVVGAHSSAPSSANNLSSLELSGTIVNRVEGGAIYPASLEGLAPGVQVYRNHDQLFSEQLRKSQSARKIRVNFSLEAAPGGLCLAAVDEDGNHASFTLEAALEPAQQVEKARETINRQLNKLGETDFECAGVCAALDSLPFIPLSALNALRRGAVEGLAAARELNRPRPSGGAVVNNAPYPEKRLAFTGNVLNDMAAQFYRRHGVEAIEPAAESGLDLAGRVVMTTKTCLRYQLNACPRQPNPQKLPEPLKLVDEQGIAYPLRFNCAACVMEVFFRKLPE